MKELVIATLQMARGGDSYTHAGAMPPPEIRLSELRNGDVEIVGTRLVIPKEKRCELAQFLVGE